MSLFLVGKCLNYRLLGFRLCESKSQIDILNTVADKIIQVFKFSISVCLATKFSPLDILKQTFLFSVYVCGMHRDLFLGVFMRIFFDKCICCFNLDHARLLLNMIALMSTWRLWMLFWILFFKTRWWVRLDSDIFYFSV